MITALAAFALASVQASPEATPLPPVSASAMSLARAINLESPILNSEPEEGIARALAGNMLNTISTRGPGCDPKLEACRAAATRVAKEAATQIVADRKAALLRLAALVFEHTMDVEERQAAEAFVKTGPGQALAASLRMVVDPRTLPSAVARELRTTLAGSSLRENDLYESFFEATKDLPRAPLPLLPPPPTMPPPPKQPATAN